MDGELDGLRLPGGVDPGGPALEAEVEGVGDLSTVLVDEGAAGQEDVAAASGSQEPGEEVGGEPVIGIGEADPLSPGPPHPEVSGKALSAVVRLDDLDVEVGSPRPAPAGPRRVVAGPVQDEHDLKTVVRVVLGVERAQEAGQVRGHPVDGDDEADQGRAAAHPRGPRQRGPHQIMSRRSSAVRRAQAPASSRRRSSGAVTRPATTSPTA